MRPQQKSNRNRGKSNRKPTGNVVNRVFDSAGPEGKVRGTPQQIIEKYETLARDAQTSGDRVTAENFLQHAEHYARMLSAAQQERDVQQERESQQRRDGAPADNQPNRQQRDQHGSDQHGSDQHGSDQHGSDQQSGNGAGGGLGMIDPADMDQPDLVVSTPEGGSAKQDDGDGSQRQRPRRPRPPRKPRDGEKSGEKAAKQDGDGGEASMN